MKMKFENQILHGDSLQILKTIYDKSVDCVITDPPYNLSGKSLNNMKNKTGGAWHKINEKWDMIENISEFLVWIDEVVRITKDSIVIFCSMHFLAETILKLKQNNCKILNIITWEKTNAIPNLSHRTLKHSTEFIIYATILETNWRFNYDVMKKYNNGKQLNDVWRNPVCQGKERTKHPSQKPLLLVKMIIDMCCNINQDNLILDPFIGSGTVGVAALQTNNKFIGIEINQEYIEIANRRIEPYLKQNKLLNGE